MNNKEKEIREKLLKLVKETPEERHERVTSGKEQKAKIIPDKRNKKPKHKSRDDEYYR